ncbi:purine-cytosine permease family protein [Entomobacter blattae]|uniref:Allantoin permease n=1 Tax=Entomobacter blattae TaxID=2762277 RepID=A0A7H1NQE3_9PROT|nr:allantoin permease [Entomobacter blattae]QNT78003.1 hypothetical protein JGUZn3_07700 [Entomobacter blattae]
MSANSPSASQPENFTPPEHFTTPENFLATQGSSPIFVKETREDYTLRYAPHSFRTWSARTVAITALGGIAYMADFSIGASIGLTYGTFNALLAIALAAIIIFTTSFPLAFYAARYNIDLDLITRGAGFGYYGSVITSIIFASFTFIFFALEGSIMAQGLNMGLGIPLWLGYLLASVIVIPLVFFGMKALSKLQIWTTPLWLFLMVGPVAYLVFHHPEILPAWLAHNGSEKFASLSLPAIMLGAGVALSLMGQIGEQIDYLRFMPTYTHATRRQWWWAVVCAGPGWVILGAIKQAIGAFIAFYVVTTFSQPTAMATEPVEQFATLFQNMAPHGLAVLLAVVLVVISQVKINVTNAYSGSLAWTSAYTRLTCHYPGRLVFVVVNVGFAFFLMEENLFALLNAILGFYANCAIAWVMVVATDITINKYLLGLSPKEPEFRKHMLYGINPVGVIAFLLASGLSIAAYFGLLGATLTSYSPLIALAIGFIAPPLLCLATKGKYYLRHTEDGILEPRFDASGLPTKSLYTCTSCQEEFERPDVMHLPHMEGITCSLCVTTQR